jgi:septal ring factor EnvC (AmiA/AmiB activator)
MTMEQFTPAMKGVIRVISGLAPAQQDELAAILSEELEAEQRWDELFAESQDLLAQLADEALAEDERGETLPFPTEGHMP